MPAPPCSSGTLTPARPSSAAWSKNARGNSPDSSISLARGRTTSSANRRTVSCSSFCSSVSSILMAFLCESLVPVGWRAGREGPDAGIVATRRRGGQGRGALAYNPAP